MSEYYLSCRDCQVLVRQNVELNVGTLALRQCRLVSVKRQMLTQLTVLVETWPCLTPQKKFLEFQLQTSHLLFVLH